ncbi:hypothetical protein K2173_010281 [Erythroxylum novogranatense]|uniref:Mitochondrial carrier protein n=1 Tax=Erythroxylum novogranatense TaxID=1862640 RepID=A0AAV8TD96_9ROSI|nr:hypothetical protein K2173_010281 [Erythroxylum novogranatense]
MSGCKSPSRSGQASITYKSGRIESATIDLNNLVNKKKSRGILVGHGHKSSESEARCPEILTTRELISTFGEIWDLVGPALSKSKEKLNGNSYVCQEGVILGYRQDAKVGEAPSLDNCHNPCGNVRNIGHSMLLMQPKLEFTNITQKMALYELCSENYLHPLFLQFSNGGINLPDESSEGKGLLGLFFKYELEKIQNRTKKAVPTESKFLVNEIDKAVMTKSCSLEINSSKKDCISGDTACQADFEGCFPEPVDGSLRRANKIESASGMTNSLHTNHFLQDIRDGNVSGTVSKALCSNLMDHQINVSALDKSTNENFQQDINDNEVLENGRKQPQKTWMNEKCKAEINSSPRERPHLAFTKQEHAFAGALAGVFVSFCLHPVDTVKTVIQSCPVDKKSLPHVAKSIVSERGIVGLYRGIASNIASSAPISAIYTFTYETIKGSLLPFFPKEYHSFAHCIAGGGASIATSFVFTPSERIKQQVQVGSHYTNCWNALFGIIRKGGLPSLYAGWGAVLCRNIPHSIIKFYTYESFKQLMLSLHSSHGSPSTLQMLACGGLAGSTAALFSTPFDVVKTRLQTQIPGSISKYDNVFHALKEIGRNEGLKGLYRGLLPRFLMYMSQGALFFASYESFKRLFCLEASSG